jgi:c-di-AMP phosphodiesterase-like protein
MDKYKVFSYILTILIILLTIVSIIVFEMGIVEVVIAGIVLSINYWLYAFLSRNQNRIVCDKCYHKNKKNTANCIKCGNDIENIICPTCKSINQYNQKYCFECETKLVCGECII